MELHLKKIYRDWLRIPDPKLISKLEAVERKHDAQKYGVMPEVIKAFELIEQYGAR